MLRPPPLQLKLDNRFPYPLKTAKPSKPNSSFVSQLYKANWKNPIIAVAGLNALRFAFTTYTAFQDAVIDDMEEAENLTLVSIALGAMYMISSVIEIYGIVSVSMQRLSMIRVYLYLTLFACLLIIGAGVLNGVSYFTFAEEIVWECVTLATDGIASHKSLFRGHPWPSSVFPLSSREARRQCVYAWVHQSWYQVVSVFIFSVIPAVIYYVLVYAYYRQTISPDHSACLINTYSDEQRHRRNSSRTEAYSQYTRVAGTDNSISTKNDGNGVSTKNISRLEHAQNLLSPRRRTAQVPKSLRGLGAINHQSSSSSTSRQVVTGVNRKPPFTSRSLKRDHRPPPLIQSPSPIGLSPGPPTYGPSRVYAAFAAPVLSGECDKFI